MFMTLCAFVLGDSEILFTSKMKKGGNQDSGFSIMRSVREELLLNL